jgi:two-component system chemotaxis response regulator CheB
MRDTGGMAEHVAVPGDNPARPVPAVQRDLIVIGASAGGVETLQDLARDLPKDLAAAVLVVLHVMPGKPSFLHQILSRAGSLPATQAREGEPLERGRIYVARPGYDLQVQDNSIHLSSDLPESGHRPAIDSLFLSAARAYGPRTIGVVLTGTLDDGAEGLRVVKDHGGATVVQDPGDAAFGEMPRNAIAHVEPDRIVRLEDLSDTLVELLVAPLPPKQASKASLTCPSCGGVLAESVEDATIHFTCQAGHAYSPESLVAQQGAALESNLLHAIRAFEERAGLLHRIAGLAERRGSVGAEARLHARAAKAAEHADEIRGTIDRLRGAEAGKPDTRTV